MQASNIAASRDTLYAGEESAVAGLIELAPDGKIYWACAYNPPNTFFYPYPDSTHNYITDNLSVINYPDSSFCDFQPFSFYLVASARIMACQIIPIIVWGGWGSPCDTLSASTQYTLNPLKGLECTYISSWQKLFINAQNLKGNSVMVSIYDGRGSAMYNGKLLIVNGYVTVDVDCTGWSDGLYVVHLQSEKEILY
ncbi:MAG: hypothetical protein IPP29_25420 [Bacteroidetes bacterium]|nr:hypothetical protein [Bacteroidota bacterium]